MNCETALAKIQEAMARIWIEMERLTQEITTALWTLKSEWWKERYQQAAALFASACLLGSSLGLWLVMHAH